MATLIQLRTRVASIIQDPSFTGPDIDGYLNQGVQELAGGVILPDGRVTPPLPLLKTAADLSTGTDPFVALPDGTGLDGEYGRGGFYLFSATLQQEIPLVPSWIKFLHMYPGLAFAGTVARGCLREPYLYYQPIPDSADTLTLHYYRKPVDMAIDTDVPDGVPAHMHHKLLVPFACKEIYSLIEDGIDGRMVKTAQYEANFNKAALDLIRYVGPEDAGPAMFDPEYDVSHEDFSHF